MNHVWVHIWPPIEADLDQLTALQAKIAPLTAGAGIEEVLVQGRIATPDGASAPLAARFHYQPGSGVVTSVEAAADRARSSRSTTTPRRSCGPVAAGSSTPTSCRR